jgi:hypothetical protein
VGEEHTLETVCEETDPTIKAVQNVAARRLVKLKANKKKAGLRDRLTSMIFEAEQRLGPAVIRPSDSKEIKQQNHLSMENLSLIMRKWRLLKTARPMQRTWRKILPPELRQLSRQVLLHPLRGTLILNQKCDQCMKRIH